MSNIQVSRFMSVMILLLASSGCDFGSPPSCAEYIGGATDLAIFNQYFNSMDLISQTTGQPGSEGEEGMQFAQIEPLVLQIDVKSEVAIRACVESRTGGGQIPFDQIQEFSAGFGVFEVGVFEPGAYVMWVIVEEVLVKSFPFETK